MKLYREVLIEAAEQAEALPLWTMATIEHHPQDALPQIAMRIVRGWRNRDLIDGRIPHADMVGWTALVPIEAEEEWGVEMSEGGVVTHVVRAIAREHAERTLSHQEPGTARIVHRVRATPWEAS